VRIKHKGNQSGYDLDLEDLNIKVDVKLSLFKDEITKSLRNWGWALRFERQGDKEPKCTHYVCVALEENYEVNSFYVINVENLDKFGGRSVKRFKNVSRGFILTTADMKQHIPDDLKEAFEYCDSLVQNKTVRKLAPNEPLLNHLK
jgi:hypothetical protein